MLNALKSQRVSLQILLPVFGFLPFLVLWIWPAAHLPTLHNAQGLLYTSYRQLLVESPLILLFGAFILVVSFASLAFWVNNRFEITGQRTVLVSYFFLFVAVTPLYISYLHPGFLSGILVFLGLLSIFTIYHQSSHLTKIFNGGIFFGLAFLCYPPNILLLPVFALAVARMKQPRIRDYLILILGFVSVIWTYGGILYLKGQLAYEWISITQWFEFRSTWPIVVPGNSNLQFIWLAWILLMLPMALAVSRSRKDVGRRIVSVLIQFLWIAPLMVLLFERISFEVWGLISFPLAILFSLAVMNARRKLMPNLIILSLLVFLIIFHLESILWP